MHLSSITFALFILAVTTAAMVLLELLRAPPAVEPTAPWRACLDRAFVGWVGVLGCTSFALLVWWGLGEYRRPYYRPLFLALPWLLIAGIPAAALLLLVTERRLGPAESGLQEIGRRILRRPAGDGAAALRDELFALAVKIFFFPINFCELARVSQRLNGREEGLLTLPWPEAHALALTMLYGLIIAAVTPGYLFHSRLLRTEVRRSDRTLFGWVVTLCCYAPFVTPVFGRLLDYRVDAAGPAWNKPWVGITAGTPSLAALVGGLILTAELIHYWGEAQFGIRSSNLTHRGIITNGPYRICKHPVYAIKCVGWALVWMPFAAGATTLECLRLTLLFLGVCGIYLLRGLAEERLLASDPDYVAYALWIDRRGLFSPLGRLIPPLSFRWRLERWSDDRSSTRE